MMLRQIVVILVIVAVIRADVSWMRRQFGGKRVDTDLYERARYPEPVFEREDKRNDPECKDSTDCPENEWCLDYEYKCVKL